MENKEFWKGERGEYQDFKQADAWVLKEAGCWREVANFNLNNKKKLNEELMKERKTLRKLAKRRIKKVVVFLGLLDKCKARNKETDDWERKELDS